MAAIAVQFGTHTFENVINVEWQHQYDRGLLVSQTTEIGQKITTFTVNGFIIIHGDPSDNVAQQQALEDSLSAIGTGTLTYTGATDIANVRFTGLQFEEYRGNPVGVYTASFATEPDNVQAHSPVVVGSLTLNIANGFQPPAVSDSIAPQGRDEQLNNLLARKLSISGVMVGNLTEVNTAQSALIAEVENKTTVVVAISVDSSGYSLTCRPGKLSFGSAEVKGSYVSRTYSFECETYEDYAKEPYTLGETALTFGTISIDVVKSTDHNTTTEREGVTYSVTEESFTVTGTKYFGGWTAYNTFVDSFRPIPVNTHFQSTNTNNTLELTDISIGEFTRDGNVPITNVKRYSANVTLSFTWLKAETQIFQEGVVLRLGINWARIGTMSHSFTINDTGAITNRSVSVSGRILDSNLAAAKGKIGTAVILGDSAILTGDNYYITSLSINSTDTNNLVGAGQFKVHDISVSATQLDTVAQRTHFLTTLFKLGTTGQLLFDKVSNQSKSISNRFDLAVGSAGGYRVSSITMSLSGEIWETDSSGSPTSINRGLDFFRIFDAQHTAEFIPGRPAATDDGTKILPTNYEVGFFLNNMSFGEWQPFTHPTLKTDYWAQSVTLSATVVFDIEASTDNDPDYVDTTSFITNDETTKFAEIQVMGSGTVFKAIGLNPATAQTIGQRQYKNQRLLDFDKTNNNRGKTNPPMSLDPPSDFPFLAADREDERDTFEVRGLTARWVKGWKATKAS